MEQQDFTDGIVGADDALAGLMVFNASVQPSTFLTTVMSMDGCKRLEIRPFTFPYEMITAACSNTVR